MQVRPKALDLASELVIKTVMIYSSHFLRCRCAAAGLRAVRFYRLRIIWNLSKREIYVYIYVYTICI